MSSGFRNPCCIVLVVYFSPTQHFRVHRNDTFSRRFPTKNEILVRERRRQGRDSLGITHGRIRKYPIRA